MIVVVQAEWSHVTKPRPVQASPVSLEVIRTSPGTALPGLTFFRSILNLLFAELPDSRGICAVGESNCFEWKMMTEFYLTSQAAWPVARHLARTVRGSQLMRGTHCTKTGHNTLLLPSGHFETEKPWPNFCLSSQTARRCARHLACTVQGSQLQSFWRLDTTHSLRFLHLSSVFSTCPNTHAAKTSVLFLSSCLLLSGSTNNVLSLPLSACFRLAWICVPPSRQIWLLFRCLDLEPNTTVNTYKQNPSTKKCSWGQLRNNSCLLCSWECLCSFPIKNSL